MDQQFGRTEGHTSRLSPAQVVVGRLHVVELTPSQCAQLIEGHSWKEAQQQIYSLLHLTMIQKSLSKFFAEF